MNYKLFLKRNLPKPLVVGIKKIRYSKNAKYIDENSAEEFKIIKKLVHADDNVIDLGAALGLYTKFLSDLVGRGGKVFSFEPIPTTFEILKYVVRRRCCPNVILSNCAISNIDREVIMDIPRYDNREENFYEAKIVEYASRSENRTLQVAARRLDSILSEQLKFSFMKIDVEGHEYECLEGAESIIKCCYPALLVEIWGNLDAESTPANRTMKYLLDLGYQPYILDGNRLNLRKRNQQSINYFFLANEHHRYADLIS